MLQFGKRIADNLAVVMKVSDSGRVYNGYEENPLREYRMFARLQPISSTDTIVQVFDVEFNDDREHCIVMEQCILGNVGENLDRLRDSTSTKYVQKLFRDLIAGLRHMHDRGICHLDLRFAMAC